LPADLGTVGTLFDLPGVFREVSLSSPVRELGTLQLAVDGEPGDTLFLFLGSSQGQALVPGLNGAFLLGATPQLVLISNLGATGQLQLNLPVPDLGLAPGTGAPVFVTGGFSTATGQSLLGGSSMTVVLDSGL